MVDLTIAEAFCEQNVKAVYYTWLSLMQFELDMSVFWYKRTVAGELVGS